MMLWLVYWGTIAVVVLTIFLPGHLVTWSNGRRDRRISQQLPQVDLSYIEHYLTAEDRMWLDERLARCDMPPRYLTAAQQAALDVALADQPAAVADAIKASIASARADFDAHVLDMQKPPQPTLE